MSATLIALAARLPWAKIGIAAGVAAALGATWRVGYGHGVKAEHERLMPRIEALASDLGTCRANSDRLEASIEAQNERIGLLAAQREAARDEIAKAEKKAVETRQRLLGLQHRLAAERLPAGRSAPMTPAQVQAWELLQ